MNESNGNLPAFANPGSEYGPGSGGLTKREYFAGLAMQGIIANGDFITSTHQSEIVKHAIELADELLTQLNKQI